MRCYSRVCKDYKQLYQSLLDGKYPEKTKLRNQKGSWDGAKGREGKVLWGQGREVFGSFHVILFHLRAVVTDN